MSVWDNNVYAGDLVWARSELNYSPWIYERDPDVVTRWQPGIGRLVDFGSIALVVATPTHGPNRTVLLMIADGGCKMVFTYARDLERVR